MKIFVLGTRGFPDIQGGVEKHCEELYPKLAKLGCDITVLTRIKYIPKEKRISEWKSVKFIHLWAPHHKNLEAIVHTFLGIIIARIKSSNLVHFHAIGPSVLIPFAKFLGLKIVMTHHGPDYCREKWGGFAKFILKLGEFLGIKFAEKVIVISKTVKKFLRQKYKRKDLEFIPNGVDLPEKISIGGMLTKYNLEPKNYILAVSRIVPEKGLHDLIEAYLKIDNPEFKLVIAGDADYETNYSRRIKALAKKNHGIILAGSVARKQLLELYANAKLFVLPSYYEGLPMALLEALSYGLPVLVSDIPANREIPLAKYRYFPVRDVDLLSDKIVELFNWYISEKEIQINKKIILKHHNWEDIARKTLIIYNNLFKRNN